MIQSGKAQQDKCAKDITFVGQITMQANNLSIEELAVKQKYLYQILDQGCQLFEVNKIKSINNEYVFSSGFNNYLGTPFRNKNNILGICQLCTLAVETATLLEIQVKSIIVQDEVLVGLNGVFTKAGHVDCFGLGIQRIINDMRILKPGVYIDKSILDTNTLSMQAAKQQVFNNYYVDELDGYNKLTAKPFLLKNMEEQFTDVFNVSSYQEKQSYMAVNHRTSYDNNFSMKGSRLLSQEVSDNSNHSFEADHQNIHNLIEKSIFQIKLKQSWMTKIYNMFLIGFQMSDQFQAKNNDYIYQKYALIFMTWKTLFVKVLIHLIVLLIDIYLEQDNEAITQLLGINIKSYKLQLSCQYILIISTILSTVLSLVYYQTSKKHRILNEKQSTQKAQQLQVLLINIIKILQLIDIIIQYFVIVVICFDYQKKTYNPSPKVAMQQIIITKYLQLQIQTYLHTSPYYNYIFSLSSSLKISMTILCLLLLVSIKYHQIFIYMIGIIISNFNILFHQVQYFEKVLLEINSRYMLETKFQTNRKNIESVFDDISLAALRQQETYLINENDFKMELVDIDYSWCEVMLKEKNMQLQLMSKTLNTSQKVPMFFQVSSPRSVSRNTSFTNLNQDAGLKLQIAILKEFTRVDNRYVNVKNICRLGECVVVLFKAKNVEELTEIHDVNIARYFEKLQQAMYPLVKDDVEMHMVRVTYDTASVLVLPNRDKKDIQTQLKKGFDIAISLVHTITQTNDQIDLGSGIGVSDVCQVQLGTYLYNFEFFGHAFQEAERAALNCKHKSVCFSKKLFEFYNPNYQKENLENIETQMSTEWVMMTKVQK
ncbi:Hypothetical_protein [Hexamita inflata]|uniref:Hypothetical_protein n=1 Tax=Hexamita inflata TaxID=28002 RepID=A0AA86TQL2_9EUKA|nr:Hypothetical protein HINF_LOCUS7218 [Hexamita inflata]